MFLWLQKRRLNNVTWSIKKHSPNKLEISIIELTVQFFTCFLNLKTLCALQDKLKLFGFKQSAFCSYLEAASGQQRSTAVARLGRKGLREAGGVTQWSRYWAQALRGGGFESTFQASACSLLASNLFSSCWYLHTHKAHPVDPVSKTFPSHCLWNSFTTGPIDSSPFWSSPNSLLSTSSLYSLSSSWSVVWRSWLCARG